MMAWRLKVTASLLWRHRSQHRQASRCFEIDGDGKLFLLARAWLGTHSDVHPGVCRGDDVRQKLQ
jgi:hypothetical protein